MQVLVDTSYCESLHFWAFYQNSTTRVNGWHHKLANKLSLGLRGRRNSSSLGAPRAVPERVCSGLVQHICCYFSLPSAHGYSVKLPNFTSFFFTENVNTRRRFCFSFSALGYGCQEFNSRKNSPVFGKLNEME